MQTSEPGEFAQPDIAPPLPDKERVLEDFNGRFKAAKDHFSVWRDEARTLYDMAPRGPAEGSLEPGAAHTVQHRQRLAHQEPRDHGERERQPGHGDAAHEERREQRERELG